MTASLSRAWLGAFGGPILWYAQQQTLVYFLPLACKKAWLEPAIAVAYIAALGVVAILSGSLRIHGPHLDEPDGIEGRTRFVEWLGALAPPLFLIAMLWQTISTLVYPGCAR